MILLVSATVHELLLVPNQKVHKMWTSSFPGNLRNFKQKRFETVTNIGSYCACVSSKNQSELSIHGAGQKDCSARDENDEVYEEISQSSRSKCKSPVFLKPCLGFPGTYP